MSVHEKRETRDKNIVVVTAKVSKEIHERLKALRINVSDTCRRALVQEILKVSKDLAIIKAYKKRL